VEAYFSSNELLLQEKRTDIGREFNAWLKECHERCDKQVKFSQYSGSITRPELVKHRQSPWSVYGLIEWDGKVFKKGTMVGDANSYGRWPKRSCLMEYHYTHTSTTHTPANFFAHPTN